MKSAAIGMIAILAATSAASAMVADGWDGVEPAVFTPNIEPAHNAPLPGTMTKPAPTTSPRTIADTPDNMEVAPVPGLCITQ